MTDTFSASNGTDGPTTADELASFEARVLALKTNVAGLNAGLGESSRLGSQFGRVLGSAFSGLVVQGKSFQVVLQNLALSLSKVLIGAAFKPLESALGSAFAGLISVPAAFGSGGLVAPASLGQIASRLDPASNSLPSSGGSVSTSAFAAHSAGSNIVLNITTPDAESFRRSETQIAAVLARAVGQGQRNL